jgi:hypothetical protein
MVVVAIDTVAILTLLALTLRDRSRSSAPRSILPQSTVASAGPASEGRPLVATSEATPSVVADPDPLADAITAFLGRSEGLFRAGGTVPGRPPAAAASGTTEPSEPPPIAVPELSLPSEPGETVEPSPAAVPNGSAILDRPRPEVTWALGRPARYVPSGQRSGISVDRSPTAEAAETTSTVAGPPGLPSDRAAPTAESRPPSGSAPALGGPPRPADPRRRPASRLRVTLAGRDPFERQAASVAIARLGPVIGGLLRERTRGHDRIEVDGPDTYAVVLPDTNLDGAEALGRRLAASCDAWLAAELPPLWLEVRPTDQPGGAPLSTPEPGRDPMTERRRQVGLDA